MHMGCLNHAVFGDPGSKAAKELLARTYDQMGYMSEAATWRNSYLTAAAELLVEDFAPVATGDQAQHVYGLRQFLLAGTFLHVFLPGLDRLIEGGNEHVGRGEFGNMRRIGR